MSGSATPPVTPRADGRQAERSWTVLELLRWTTDHFAGLGIETARLDAEILLAHALGAGRMQLYVDFEKPVHADERARFRELVRRRGGERIPVSQLLGSKEFWSLELRITSDVLTPRPDTETLVQGALDRIPEPETAWRVSDIGTGSGAIGLAIASERPNAHVVATDISEAALKVAVSNAEALQLSERVRFVQGSLFEALDGEEPFDLVVSNPPYLARADAGSLPPELRHEPDEALFGGEDGLEVLRPLVAGAREVLKPGGHLLVEIDPEQADVVVAQCREVGFGEIAPLRDLAGRIRVIAARA
jgi:release factor glutamine methyltransferase